MEVKNEEAAMCITDIVSAGARCTGVGGVAAPCDYKPVVIASSKIRRTGEPLVLNLIETPDVVARLGEIKQSQWMVAFALETEDRRFRALAKLEKKSRCWISSTSP